MNFTDTQLVDIAQEADRIYKRNTDTTVSLNKKAIETALSDLMALTGIPMGKIQWKTSILDMKIDAKDITAGDTIGATSVIKSLVRSCPRIKLKPSASSRRSRDIRSILIRLPVMFNTGNKSFYGGWYYRRGHLIDPRESRNWTFAGQLSDKLIPTIAAYNKYPSQIPAFWHPLLKCLAVLVEAGPIMALHSSDFKDTGKWDLYISERIGEVHFDERGRLHNPDGPAINWGKSEYYIHGVQVTKSVISGKGISVRSINNQANAEVRRIMMEKMGFESYLRGSKAKKIHTDKCGILYEIPDPQAGRFHWSPRRQTWTETGDPNRVVLVTNSTAEPDGTFKKYMLSVPPTTKTAKAGVAWTFRVKEKDYNPEKES